MSLFLYIHEDPRLSKHMICKSEVGKKYRVKYVFSPSKYLKFIFSPSKKFLQTMVLLIFFIHIFYPSYLHLLTKLTWDWHVTKMLTWMSRDILSPFYIVYKNLIYSENIQSLNPSLTWTSYKNPKSIANPQLIPS